MVLIQTILNLSLFLWKVSANLTDDLKKICDEGKESNTQRNTLIFYNRFIVFFFYYTFSAEFPAILRPHQRDKRIVNGFETGKDGLFYQLMLVIGVNEREWQHFCGATLITNQYAMSAYHCFTLLIEDHLELLSADYSRKERLGNDIIELITVVAGRYQSHPLGST